MDDDRGTHLRGRRGVPEEGDDSGALPWTPRSHVSEATPLLPPHLQIEVSNSVKENQDKWKHLMEIDASDNTAQQMADDNDEAIEILKFMDDKEFPRTQHDLSRSLSLSYVLYSPVTHDSKATWTEVDKYMVAAAFIEDGIHGRKIGYRIDAQALRMVRWFHSTWYQYLFNFVGIGCCALAFVETTSSSGWTTWLLMELVCLAGFSMDVYCLYAMSSDKTKANFRKREPWATLRFVLLALTFADIALYLAGISVGQPRYTRMFRPFMVIARRRNIRIVFASFLRALNDVAVILALTLCVVLFFGLMGFLLFADSSVILNVPYFATLGDSLYNMLLIQSCLPVMMSVMLPYYIRSQWSALYFVVFVLFTNFFLVKLTIAVSYRRYKRNTEKMLYKRLQKRKIALNKAFDLLSDDLLDDAIQRTVTLDAWLAVCRYLKPTWTAEEAKVVFYSSDMNQTNEVNLTQFIQLSSVLVNATVTRRQRRQSLFIQGMKKWQNKTRNVLLAQTTVWGYPVIYMEVFVGFLICLSVVQATQVNNYALTNSLNHTWRLVGMGLLSLFTVEIALKLFAFGSVEFFNRPFCKFDIVVATVGWLFYAMTSLIPAFPVVFYDLALAIRSLRVLKVLNLIPPFHNILWTMNRIIPLIGQLFLVILSVVYVFAILAQANYGQLLARFPESLKDNASTWYIHKEEFRLDTFENCLVTLFEEATLAGWNSIMDALFVVTESPNTLVFFFTFRITISNILLPIFVGFLVESFSSNQKPAELEEVANEKTLTVVPGTMPPSSNDPGAEIMPPKRVKYKMSFQRRTSDVQSAMFDFSSNKIQVDQYERKVKELNLIVHAKNQELAALRAQLDLLQTQTKAEDVESSSEAL